MGVQIGGQHRGDFRPAGSNVDTDSLVLQQLEPLPRPLFVWKGARKVSGIVVDLSSVVDAIGVLECCIELPRAAEEFGSRLHVDGLNLPFRDEPVLRQA